MTEQGSNSFEQPQEPEGEREIIGLPQTRILALLNEYGNKETSGQRLHEIHIDLTEQFDTSHLDEDDPTDAATIGHANAMSVFVRSLLIETRKARPDLLPSLIIPISMACGERDSISDLFANPDFSLAPPTKPQAPQQ